MCLNPESAQKMSPEKFNDAFKKTAAEIVNALDPKQTPHKACFKVNLTMVKGGSR